MLKFITSWLVKKHNEVAMTITSVGSIIIAIVANSLYGFIETITKENVLAHYKNIIIAALIIVTGVAIYFFSCIVIWTKKTFWPDYMDEYYMKHAFIHLKKLGGKRQEVFQKLLSNPMQDKKNTDELYLQLEIDNMQQIIQCCYDFFESAFTDIGQLVNEIKFEATFMTKSYIDSKITIPCSANKKGCAPVSMQLRKSNPDIYDKTETAKIYNMKRPVMMLIEDTSSETGEYEEIYEYQKKRIKSSVILPVLSRKNELLGTLVVHCDKPNFFKMDRYQFWDELLDMFAVELGYHKEVLDFFVNECKLGKPF